MINKRFRIKKKIGQGRSSVFLCEDNEFPNSSFAIKLISPGAGVIEKENFIREYFILRNLDHPNIVKSYEIGKVVHTDGDFEIQLASHFITLEFIDSKELLNSPHIKTEQGLFEITAQICSVLYYLHQSRYIYYDLKPENILVASVNGKPVVKLIDLGLAEYSPDLEKYTVKGTVQYIAPELLKKEPHNHSVDLYSLGMLLYRIIYNRLPFNTVNELEIYKEQIEYEFEFPPSGIYSDLIVNITKKLLAKEPSKRFGSALEVLFNLNSAMESVKFIDFVPAKILAGRGAELALLNDYLSDNESSGIITLKGFNGTGKTALLNKLYEMRSDSVLIGEVKGKSGIGLVKYALQRILFSDSVFQQLDDEGKADAINLFDKMNEGVRVSFRSAITPLLLKCRFILLIDDFNLMDEFASELFQEIIPVLQVNNIKVIVAESSENPFYSGKLHNVKEVLLHPFTDEQLNEFIDKSFIDGFPKNEMKALIQSHSDLIPGNIISFIKDLIYFDILQFSGSGAAITHDENKIALLKQSHSSVYDLRLSRLTESEMKVLMILSALNITIDMKILSELAELPPEEIERLIQNIQINNVLQNISAGLTFIFTSEGLKKYIYSKVKNPHDFHFTLAEKLLRITPKISNTELARQYELAGKFELCYQVLEPELVEAEKHSAFAYMKNLLEHLLQLPFEASLKNLVKIKLSECYYKLGDFNSALQIIKSLNETDLNDDKFFSVKNIEAGSLIGIGEFVGGKEIIIKLLNLIKDEGEKNRLTVELAYADFEQKNYEEAENRCDYVLSKSNLPLELRGRCHNLKGMRRIYQANDLHSALVEFEKALVNFNEAKSLRRVAGMEVNIGNIYTLLNDYEKAEMHWRSALDINRLVGNLEQEGIILLNLGLSNYFRGNFDSAIEHYKRAQKIFLNIGNELNLALVFLNLGEVFIKICEYQNSLNALEESQRLFKQMENFEDVAEVYVMLAKLYFEIGYNDKFKEAVNEIKKLHASQRLPEKHSINLKFLQLLSGIISGEKTDSEEIYSVRNEFKEIDDRSYYIESSFLLIKKLISDNLFEEALKVISEKFFVDLCLQNSILEAEREYFLGKISLKYASDKIRPPLEHFEDAYNLVKNQSVTEMTWKILLAMAEIYIERGNFQKAKVFTVYGRELINLIAEKIESPRLRAAYLKQPERYMATQTFDRLYQN